MFMLSYCLAPSASSHLSLGPHEVDHNGVATGRRDFSLADTHAKAGFRIGYSSTVVELDWRFPLFYKEFKIIYVPTCKRGVHSFMIRIVLALEE